jgi:thioredoxin-dependent peroxiredoxin
MPEANSKAPDFTLPDESGKKVSLKDYRGKDVVLYFFPKADTPGWTIEARQFGESFPNFEKIKAVILGVSADSPEQQKKFKEKYDLPFTLLADVDKKVCMAYDVIKEKNMYGKKSLGIERTTFLIGPDGKIKHVFHKVKADGHAEEVLTALKESAQAAD